MTPDSEWYYLLGTTRCGPVELNTLERFAANGIVLPETPVWTAGLEDWQPYAALLRSAPQGPSCRDCRTQDSLLQRIGTIWVCEACLAARMERTGHDGSSAEKMQATRAKAATKLIGGILGLVALLAVIILLRDLDKGSLVSAALVGLVGVFSGLSGITELLFGKSNTELIARWDAIRRWQQIALGWAIFLFAMLAIFGGIILALHIFYPGSVPH